MSGNRSKFGSNIKHSNHNKRHHRRESVNLFRQDLEPALLIFDVPNINSLWYGTNPGKKHCIRFPYRLLGNAYRNFLSWKYKGKFFDVGSAVFLNERENQDYEFFSDLRDNHGWYVFKKPKLNPDDDIDEDIKAYIEFMLEEKPYMHVMLVGNDLRNYIPIAKSLLEQNIRVSMLCAFNHFYPVTLNRLQNLAEELGGEEVSGFTTKEELFEVLDLKEFFGCFSKVKPAFPW